MPANLTRHLPLLLGLACISLTSTAWSATCTLTPAVNNGEKHLVDYIRQPDGKSLGIPGQVI